MPWIPGLVKAIWTTTPDYMGRSNSRSVNDMSTIVPFTINVEESRLHRLHQKLELTDFPDELDEAGWTYGAPLTDVKRLAKHWKDGFNWREQEAELNQLPQFTTNIVTEGFGELNIHFVHQKSDVATAIPLLFIHGCKTVQPTYRGERYD